MKKLDDDDWRLNFFNPEEEKMFKRIVAKIKVFYIMMLIAGLSIVIVDRCTEKEKAPTRTQPETPTAQP